MKSYASKLAVLAIVCGVSTGAIAQETPNAAAHSFNQMLNTDTYAGILKSMVNPTTLQNPVAVCAQCHNGEDLARYQKSLGPMMQMVNPVNWVNPMAYVNMAAPMVDPETYTEWYNAWVKKYGGLLGYGDEAAPAGAAEPAPSSE